ncbi:MAG: tetratricopeptide repeat protein [Planctomycetota bacterium]
MRHYRHLGVTHVALWTLATLGMALPATAQRGGNGNGNGTPAPTPEELVRSGNAAFDQQRYTAAAQLYQQALEATPGLPFDQTAVVYLNLAHTRYRLEQWQRAIDAYSRSNADDAMQLIAQCHLQLGNADEASSALRNVLVRFPDRADVREQLAQIESSRGLHREAITLLRKLLELRPNDAKLHRSLARELLTVDRLTEGLDALETSWRLGNRTAEVARLIGDLYLQQDMPLEAATYYRRYLSVAGDPSAEDHFRAGYAYYQGEEYRSAKEMFAEAIARDPSYARGLFYLGNIAASEGDTERAMTEYAAALEHNPQLRDAHEAVARLHLEQERYPEAAQAYASALETGANSFSIHYNRVVAVARSGERAAAIAALKEALHAHPDRSELLGLLALLPDAPPGSR